MMEICFATNNGNKIKEVQRLVGDQFKLLSLHDIGCTEELLEEQDTLEGNAIQKAQYVFDKYKVNCFADDTGLEVLKLNNAPGVYSARYAGVQRSSEDNMKLVLKNLIGIKDRSAFFRTVICSIIDGKQSIHEGKVEGEIISEFKGTEGFGYDPIFKAKGQTITFAEMTLEEKNLISHRALAFSSFNKYLRSNFLKG